MGRIVTINHRLRPPRPMEPATAKQMFEAAAAGVRAAADKARVAADLQKGTARTEKAKHAARVARQLAEQAEAGAVATGRLAADVGSAE